MTAEHVDVIKPATVPRADWLDALRRSPDLLALIGLTLLLPLLIYTPLMLIRIPVGLFLVLVAPGYALTSAMFPRRDDLDGISRGALSLGLSIAVIPAFALLLSVIRVGIHPMWITITLALWTISLSTLAVRRRQAIIMKGEAFTLVDAGAISWRGDSNRNMRRWLAAGVPLLMIVVILGLVVPFVVDSRGAPTAFYVLGEQGQARHFPTEVATSVPVTVTVGISNGADTSQEYHIEIWRVDPYGSAESMLLEREGPVTVPGGERHEWPVSWRMPRVGDDQSVELLLFQGNSHEPFRRLKLWLDVTGPTSPLNPSTGD